MLRCVEFTLTLSLPHQGGGVGRQFPVRITRLRVTCQMDLALLAMTLRISGEAVPLRINLMQNEDTREGSLLNLDSEIKISSLRFLPCVNVCDII